VLETIDGSAVPPIDDHILWLQLYTGARRLGSIIIAGIINYIHIKSYESCRQLG
jgi:hypothetical protein